MTKSLKTWCTHMNLSFGGGCWSPAMLLDANGSVRYFATKAEAVAAGRSLAKKNSRYVYVRVENRSWLSAK